MSHTPSSVVRARSGVSSGAVLRLSTMGHIVTGETAMSQRGRSRTCPAVGVLLIAVSLTSCEHFRRQREFWKSPEGQRLQAMQWMQVGDQLHRQNLQFQQQSYQAEQLQLRRMHELQLRSRPIKVEHSGSVELRRRGTVRIRRQP